MNQVKLNWDALGIGTSLACAIHCAVLPLLATSLPLFGLDIIHNLWFEWVMIVLAMGIGYYALVHGYQKHHRRILPLILFSAGILFLVLKQFIPGHETLLLIPAVLLIVLAHGQNYQLCRRMKRSGACAHHKHD